MLKKTLVISLAALGFAAIAAYFAKHTDLI